MDDRSLNDDDVVDQFIKTVDGTHVMLFCFGVTLTILCGLIVVAIIT